jgi:type I restriction enzyme, S subunit
MAPDKHPSNGSPASHLSHGREEDALAPSPEGAKEPGELPQGWRRVAVKDMADSIQYGHTASAVERKDGPRFLRITDIQDGRVDWSAVPSCDIAKPDIPKYRLSSGDLVFARTGATTGKSFLIGDCPEAVFASYLIRVRVSADVDSRYLSAFFQSPDYWRQIEGGKRGIGQPNVNGTVLGEVQFPVPPLPEQRRIVAEIEKQFTRLEAAAAALRRVQANLKRYRAAVLKAACEGRLVASEDKDWNIDSLGNVLVSIEAGKSFKCEERPPTPSEIGVVKVSAVTWGTYNDLESKTCLDPDRVEKRFLVRPGDFLFSRANTIQLIGACVIAQKVTLQVMLSDKILRFRFSSAVNPSWVLYWLRSDFGRSEIERLATGNQESMRNIGQERIRQIAIKLPPLAEQTRIVAEVERRLSVVEELEAVVSANLQRAGRLRQSILQKAFSGELV